MSAVCFVGCHTFRFQRFQLPKGVPLLVHGFRACFVQRHEMRGMRGRIETRFMAFLCYLHTARFAFFFVAFFLDGVAGGSEWVCLGGKRGGLRTNL